MLFRIRRGSFHIQKTAGRKSRGAQDAPDLLEVVGKVNALLPLFGRESLFDHLLQKRLQRMVVTVQVVEDARRVQMLQRHLGHDLCDLLQRSRAAGEGDKGIAEFDHLALALRHVLGHDELSQAVMLEFALDEAARLDAGHFSAGAQNAVRDRAHHNKKPDYIYGMAFDDYDIRFMVAEGILTVKEVTRRTQEWKKVK